MCRVVCGGGYYIYTLRRKSRAHNIIGPPTHHLFAGCVYFNCIPANNSCMTILLFRERVSLSLSRPPSQYVSLPLSLSGVHAIGKLHFYPSIQSTLTEFSVTHFYIQTETTDRQQKPHDWNYNKYVVCRLFYI